MAFGCSPRRLGESGELGTSSAMSSIMASPLPIFFADPDDGVLGASPDHLDSNERLFDDFDDFDDLDEATSHRLGDVIQGRYELIEPIGAGGMGFVWHAFDHTLHRQVAVKVVRADRASPQVQARLLTEARAAAAVNHPGVVDILDFGTTEESDTFLVMELLEGIDLDEDLMRGTWPCVEAVKLIAALADALAAAHDAGVVHRDIKPGNVVLKRAGDGSIQPVLVDFGIARILGDANNRSPSRLTATGHLLGTPAYMSPEQAAGERQIDERTDLWTLTALLYELLTGGPPFDGDNYNAILKAVLMNEPERLGAAYGVDDELWAIIDRGLSKPRESRYTSARAMAEALDGWLLRRGETTDARGRILSSTAELLFSLSSRHSEPDDGPSHEERADRAATEGLAPATIIGIGPTRDPLGASGGLVRETPPPPDPREWKFHGAMVLAALVVVFVSSYGLLEPTATAAKALGVAETSRRVLSEARDSAHAAFAIQTSELDAPAAAETPTAEAKSSPPPKSEPTPPDDAASRAPSKRARPQPPHRAVRPVDPRPLTSTGMPLPTKPGF